MVSTCQTLVLKIKGCLLAVFKGWNGNQIHCLVVWVMFQLHCHKWYLYFVTTTTWEVTKKQQIITPLSPCSYTYSSSYQTINNNSTLRIPLFLFRHSLSFSFPPHTKHLPGALMKTAFVKVSCRVQASSFVMRSLIAEPLHSFCIKVDSDVCWL